MVSIDLNINDLGRGVDFWTKHFFLPPTSFSMMINPPKLIGEQIGKESQ